MDDLCSLRGTGCVFLITYTRFDFDVSSHQIPNTQAPCKGHYSFSMAFTNSLGVKITAFSIVGLRRNYGSGSDRTQTRDRVLLMCQSHRAVRSMKRLHLPPWDHHTNVWLHCRHGDTSPQIHGARGTAYKCPDFNPRTHNQVSTKSTSSFNAANNN